MNKLTISFALLAISVGLVGCGGKNNYSNMKDKPLPVEVEVVSHSAQVVNRSYIGEIDAKTDIALVFPLGGEIQSINVNSGDRVRKGQLIATVDDTQASALLDNAKALLAQAEDGYRRLKPVHENGGISDVKWVEMETNLERARSMKISAQKRYDDCSIRACQDGVVNLREGVEVGLHLAVAQPIGSLLDMSGMSVSFTVPESEIGNIMPGDSLEIEVNAIGGHFNAIVREKSLTSTHLAHTYKVMADIVEKNASQSLLPGMVCRVMIPSQVASGFIISAGCVQTQQKGHSVWVVRNGRTERVMIKIADYVDNGVLVDEGLHAGDTVVSKGYQKMFNGAKVTF